MNIARLDSRAGDFDARFDALLAFENSLNPEIESAVASILQDVRRRGDRALVELTRKFDQVEVADASGLEIPRTELEAAYQSLASTRREALEAATGRIRSFHERQRAESWEYREADGTRLGQKVTPLDRVGIYVPGGKASYPSSVLMNAIPAKVAGVGEIIMVVPTPDGIRNPLVMAAAWIAGVDRVFAIGGAQAVAALAYGTALIPPVDKIVGPGNAYVAAAKRQVFGRVGIDMVAGPSEILVISDGTTPPDWIAMDLFSQAEHDEVAQALLLSPDDVHLDAVAASMDKLIATMPRRAVISASMSARGALVRVRDLAEACDLSNRVAPEHLELSVADPDQWLPGLRHAGAIFLGRFTSEALGDYCAGPNHVLPTARTARFSSPLGVYDFQKRTSVIGVSREASIALGRIAAELADGEGLPAHAASARFRFHA